MNGAAPTLFSEVVSLCGVSRAGVPIERCNGDFKQTWLLMPGTGVYFLVDRSKFEPLAVTATRRQDPGAPA